jgi:hypothetical protein
MLIAGSRGFSRFERVLPATITPSLVVAGVLAAATPP